MIDLGGQDATEAFEDGGHSEEARRALNELCVAELTTEVSDTSKRNSTVGAPTLRAHLSWRALCALRLLGSLLQVYGYLSA